MADEITQRRNNITAMELLERSQTAYAVGDRHAARELIDQAKQIAPDTVLVLGGAMRIGEVPQPGTAQWAAYLADQRAALADLEAEPGSDDVP